MIPISLSAAITSISPASAAHRIFFLIASPWNSFSLTLILIALIGLPWTLAFIGLSMLVALVTFVVVVYFTAIVRMGSG